VNRCVLFIIVYPYKNNTSIKFATQHFAFLVIIISGSVLMSKHWVLKQVSLCRLGASRTAHRSPPILRGRRVAAAAEGSRPAHSSFLLGFRQLPFSQAQKLSAICSRSMLDHHIAAYAARSRFCLQLLISADRFITTFQTPGQYTMNLAEQIGKHLPYFTEGIIVKGFGRGSKQLGT
jgi:hypothetical protein